jgi:hypothetical protein
VGASYQSPGTPDVEVNWATNPFFVVDEGATTLSSLDVEEANGAFSKVIPGGCFPGQSPTRYARDATSWPIP